MNTSRLVAALAVVVLAGCSLYLGSPGMAADDEVPPDSTEPPPPADDVTIARCEDGALYQVSVPRYQAAQPGHGTGHLAGHCSGACRSAAVECTEPTCASAAATLCGAPPSTGAACDLEGAACTSGETLECPQSTVCGTSLAGASCACGAGDMLHCTPETDAPEVQAALVGKWQGTVTPPSFAAPYAITLWIYPDGTYWAEAVPPQNIAFYYGGDGPHPERRITILSSSPTLGSWADIGINFGGDDTTIGSLSALTVDASHLRFTFMPSWLGCERPFQFDLNRI
jgi:hypothetical protein